MIHEFASAKVNLTLEVLGKREDGYHLLRSLVAFSDIGDKISFEPGNDFSLTISGPFGNQLDGPNLIEKVAGYLQSRFSGLPTGHFHLEKNLPVASGIGGGSADAAAAIRLMCQAGNVDVRALDVNDIAYELGADIPVCLAQQPVMMEGIGEVLKPVREMPELAVVLVNPGVGVSTGRIFGLLNAQVWAGESDEMAAPVFDTSDRVVDYMQSHSNDLQTAAIKLEPVISDVIDDLAGQQGCLIARMSGSGATCFGIFSDKDLAGAAASRISEDHPEWWVRAGVLKPAE